MIKQGLKFARTHCRKVYLAGEHSTAGMYAVCEFNPGFHLLLIAASIILLIGILLVGLDSVLESFGI